VQAAPAPERVSEKVLLALLILGVGHLLLSFLIAVGFLSSGLTGHAHAARRAERLSRMARRPARRPVVHSAQRPATQRRYRRSA